MPDNSKFKSKGRKKQTKKKQKNSNKNKKSGIICAIMIAFVWYASFLSFFSMNLKKFDLQLTID